MKYLSSIAFLTFFSSALFAKELKTEILINAAPQKIWKILTDFENYPKWNPFITFIKGEAIVGKKISIKVEPPNSRAMTFEPEILVFETNKELLWLGHFLFSGLFDGEHKFELIDNGNGTTTFKQSEDFGGILVPCFGSSFDDTLEGFKAMNEKLKELAEKE